MLYFDNAATTQISKESLDAYVKASECFYNPSSLYAPSVESKNMIETSRKYILSYLNGKRNSTLIFTAGASESNNAVLNSVIIRKDKKYIFSAGEHSSVYETAKRYQEKGFNIVFIPLLSNGAVDENKLYEELDDSTALVSIIYVSNETGAVNNIKEICDTVKSFNKNITVHTDAVQALGKLKIDVTDLNVDYLTLSAHKINGPKGIGALYIAEPNKFKPLIHGGGQEYGLRAGTENTPAINAFAKAIEQIKHFNYAEHKKAILDNLYGDYVLVSDDTCVDNIISLCFKNVRGETIEHILEGKGILVGTGSSCNSKAGKNRVLSQIVNSNYIDGVIRLSFDNQVSVEDCKYVAIELSKAVEEYIERIKR